MLKQSVRLALSAIGLEVTRKARGQHVPLADIASSALHSVYMVPGGQRAAFMCPLNDCRTIFGFGFGNENWHPFTAAIEEYAQNTHLRYDGSILHRYYQVWQPSDARHSVVGFFAAPERFGSHPPYAFTPPWHSLSLEDRRAQVSRSCIHDYREHGSPPLDLDVHGYRAFGPASDELGGFEFGRLMRVYKSILSVGYQRVYGDIEVDVVRRGSDLIFVSGAGQHRRAAMSAIGSEAIPAVIRRPVVIDTRDVDYWPAVAQGTWTRADALSYVDHLFDFDSMGWAHGQGLTTRGPFLTHDAGAQSSK